MIAVFNNAADAFFSLAQPVNHGEKRFAEGGKNQPVIDKIFRVDSLGREVIAGAGLRCSKNLIGFKIIVEQDSADLIKRFCHALLVHRDVQLPLFALSDIQYDTVKGLNAAGQREGRENQQVQKSGIRLNPQLIL